VEAIEALQALFTLDDGSDPYPHYADLLAAGDVFHPSPWLSVFVVGYAAIESVLLDPTFQVPGAGFDETFPAWREHPSMSMNTIHDLDGKEHTRVRGHMSRAFSHRRVRSLAPSIAARTAGLLDDMADRGSGGESVDFVTQFGDPLTVNVICDLIGIPPTDRETLRSLAVGLLAGMPDERHRSHEDLAIADAATIQLNEYFTALASERRSHPRDDLLSVLVQVHDTGDGRLNDSEMLDNLNAVLANGFLNTTSLLANGLTLMLSDPQMAAAMRDAEIAPADFVEETLRYEAPGQMAGRHAAASSEIGGVPVRAGAHVILLIGAGNRDPRRFDSPDRFDPRRPDAGALTFGFGPHFCLGAALARLEATIALPALLTRFPAIALAGEARRVPGWAFRGFESLPVTVV
jgi:cytochrome P450